MLAELLSIKFLILYLFILSAIYIHFRGQVRFKFFRQFADHSTFMAPINVIMYFFSSLPNKPYLDQTHFPELESLKDQWQMIRDEVLVLHQQGMVKASDKYDDAGFNSFFRTGWKRFYLKWYGESLPSAKALCPKTVALLESIPSVNGAMFAMLPSGSRLVQHRDPYAGSVRYHLGLVTPNSDKCHIYVDGIPYYWRDGEAVMFDETYIHYAENQTDIDRLILFCDIKRPMRFKFADKINYFFCKYLIAGSAAQNTENDKIGFINRAFKYVYQIRLVGKRLKKYNRKLYYFVKYCLFATIFALIFLVHW